MLNEITFKTELSEIITIEEIAILFDTIKKKHDAEIILLSLYPQLNEIRKKIVNKAIEQRNKELSKLLSEISRRKQEIKINIWKKLSTIESNKRSLQNNAEKQKKIEQIIYEAEQIINVYENSIKMLDRKEKQIITGKYSRLENVKLSSRKLPLKKQLEGLKNTIISISNQHDECFADYIDELENLIKNTIINNNLFMKFKPSEMAKQYSNPQSLIIKENIEINDNKIHYRRNQETKDFYIYEPNQEDLDDELIFQLLAQGNYDDEDGTINGLILPQTFIEYEET